MQDRDAAPAADAGRRAPASRACRPGASPSRRTASSRPARGRRGGGSSHTRGTSAAAARSRIGAVAAASTGTTTSASTPASSSPWTCSSCGVGLALGVGQVELDRAERRRPSPWRPRPPSRGTDPCPDPAGSRRSRGPRRRRGPSAAPGSAASTASSGHDTAPGHDERGASRSRQDAGMATRPEGTMPSWCDVRAFRRSAEVGPSRGAPRPRRGCGGSTRGPVLPGEDAHGRDAVESQLLEGAEEGVPVDLALADVEVLVDTGRSLPGGLRM